MIVGCGNPTTTAVALTGVLLFPWRVLGPLLSKSFPMFVRETISEICEI